jgi:hypothetical protein
MNATVPIVLKSGDTSALNFQPAISGIGKDASSLLIQHIFSFFQKLGSNHKTCRQLQDNKEIPGPETLNWQINIAVLKLCPSLN